MLRDRSLRLARIFTLDGDIYVYRINDTKRLQ